MFDHDARLAETPVAAPLGIAQRMELGRFEGNRDVRAEIRQVSFGVVGQLHARSVEQLFVVDVKEGSEEHVRGIAPRIEQKHRYAFFTGELVGAAAAPLDLADAPQPFRFGFDPERLDFRDQCIELVRRNTEQAGEHGRTLLEFCYIHVFMIP